MDISRHGEKIHLTFEDNERDTISHLATSAQPIVETRCSAEDKQIIASQGQEAREAGDLHISLAHYEQLRRIARVALTTPHQPTRELLAQPKHEAALGAIRHLYASPSELL